MTFSPVNCDFNATTPLAPGVLDAMLPYLQADCGNPSSRHEFGRAARRAVDAARESVAAAVGAHPSEIVFTSGGSEANNLALKGAAAPMRPGVLAVGATEHPSVLEPVKQLARQGWQIESLTVGAEGVVTNAAVERALARRPAIVALMLANNETGVVQPIADIARRFAIVGALVHCDAVQALGKRALDFRLLGVASMALSAHKIGGPKGVGALVLSKRVDLQAQIAGGGQERNLRSGTENVAGIVGFGKACELLAGRVQAQRRLAALRDRLESALRAGGATVFGSGAERLDNTSFFAFPGVDGETLVGRLDRAGFAVASGSACSSTSQEASHVLLAMGVPESLARGAVRVSLGPEAREAELGALIESIDRTVRALCATASVAA
jgi:cysteine desulfurase